jgi:hypothetical protein
MADTDDTQPTETQAEPADPSPAPAAAPTPAPAAPDIEALLAAERVKLQADVDARIAAAREEAIVAERERVAEEQRQAAMTEAERELERGRAADAERQRLADELAAERARVADKAREAEAVARKLALADALTESDLRLARSADGSIDPALRELVYAKAEQLTASGKTQAEALADLAKTSPWMFATGPSAAPTTTTGSGATTGSRVHPPLPPEIDIKNNPQDHIAFLDRVRAQQRTQKK